MNKIYMDALNEFIDNPSYKKLLALRRLLPSHTCVARAFVGQHNYGPTFRCDPCPLSCFFVQMFDSKVRICSLLTGYAGDSMAADDIRIEMGVTTLALINFRSYMEIIEEEWERMHEL